MDLIAPLFPTRMPFSAHPWLRTQDLDEAAQLLCSQLEERELKPCSNHRPDIHFTLQHLDQMKLFGADWGLAVNVRSRPLASWHGILPLRGAISCRLDGRTAQPGELLLFTPGHEVDVLWHANARAVVISLEAACLQDHVRAHHRAELSRKATSGIQLIDARHPAMSNLSNLLQLVESDATSPNGLLSTPVGQKHLLHLFCENLLQIIPGNDELHQRSLLPGVVKRVVDYIHAHLDQPLSFDELVAVSGASRRTLESAFRRSLGTSPRRYIQQRRLEALRELLLRHRPGEVQLSELAYRWGFSQPSHFTSAYKQAFGELPSQTLAR